MDYAALGELIQRQEWDTPFSLGGSDPIVVIDHPDVLAPEVYHDEKLDVYVECADEWVTVTGGMSGQYGYRGAVMHASEFIGAAIAERLDQAYERGTVFVVCVVESSVDELDAEPAGWCILRKVGAR